MTSPRRAVGGAFAKSSRFRHQDIAEALQAECPGPADYPSLDAGGIIAGSWSATRLAPIGKRAIFRPLNTAHARQQAEQERARRRLADTRARINALLDQWRHDGVNRVTLKLMQAGLRGMGFELDDVDIGEAFMWFELGDDNRISLAQVRRELWASRRLGLRIQMCASKVDPAGDTSELERANKSVEKIPLERWDQQRSTAGCTLKPTGSKHASTIGDYRLLAASFTGKPAVQQLRTKVTRNLARAVDMFHKMDVDSSGTVDKNEFVEGLRAMHIGGVTTSEALEIFEELDVDGSGTIELDELYATLRHGRNVQTQSLSEVASRSCARSQWQIASPRAKTDKPHAEELLRRLVADRERILLALKNGETEVKDSISRLEWRIVLGALGFNAERADVDTIFRLMDADKRGHASVSEVELVLGWAEKSWHRDRKRRLLTTTDPCIGARPEEVQRKLRAALGRSMKALLDLLSDCARVSGSNTRCTPLTRRQFHRAILMLGIRADLEDVDVMFEAFDTGRSGVISVEDLPKILQTMLPDHRAKMSTVRVEEDDVVPIDPEGTRDEIRRGLAAMLE